MKLYRLFLIFSFLWMFMGTGMGSSLLTPKAAPAPATEAPGVKDLDDLIQTLESAEGREKFLSELKTLRNGLKSNEPSQGSALSFHTNALFDSLVLIKTEFFYNLQQAVTHIISFGKSLTFENVIVFAKNAGFFILALIIGLGIEYVFKRLFIKVKKQMVLNMGKPFMRLAYLILLKILSLFLGLSIFIITSSTILITFHLEASVSRALMMIIIIMAGAKGIIQLSKILINPRKPMMGVGSKIHHDLLRGGFIFIRHTTLVIMMAAIILYGISFSPELKTLAPLIEGIIFAHLTVLVFRLMSFIQAYQKTHKVKRESWPTFIKIYVVMQTGIILLFGHQSLLEFLVKGTSTLLVLIGISLVIDKFPRVSKIFLLKMRTYSPTIKNREKLYLLMARLGLGILMLTTLLACLTSIWSDPFWDWVWASYKQKFSVVIFNLFLLVALGILLWEGSDFILNQHFQSRARKGTGTKSLKRYETLLPLMRNTLRVFIGMFVGLTIISECGFNITPILAGASVVGIALSLGAQSLVKDFINGCFIILENTIMLGDYVEVGGHAGTVETLTLRSLTLRDPLGGVHTVPFSTITTVVNLSKNFSKCEFLLKFDGTIPYEKVRKLLKQTGKKLQEKEEVKSKILGKLYILEIQKLEGNEYTVKFYLTVAPGKQWKIEHIFLETLSQNLEEHKLKPFSLQQFTITENATRPIAEA